MKFSDLKIEHLWVITVLGICFGYVCTMPVPQYDFWHYLETGKIFFTTHKIVDKEIFTFTALNTSYINLHWASQIFYYFFYTIGGIKLLAFLHAVIITASFSLVFLIAWKESRNLRISSFVTLLTIVLSVTNFALRPQEFSILFFALTLYLLKTKNLWFIPPLFIFWVNFHGAFIVGIVLIFTEWLGSIKLTEKKDLSIGILATLLFTIFTTLFTPWGYKIFPTILNAESQNFANLVHEWSPPSIHEPAGMLFFSALIGFFILTNIRKNHWTKKELITFIIFTVLALLSQRTIVWWAIVTAPLFATALSEIFTLKNSISNETQRKGNVVINWIFVIMLFFYFVGCLPWLKTKNIFLPEVKRELIASDTPLKLSNYLGTAQECHKIFNNFAWGSYFIWSLRSDQKIFISPWLSVFPKKVVNEYLMISNGYAKWEDILNKYNVDTLALEKNEQSQLIPLVKSSKIWVKAYEDKQGIVFKRNKS